MVIPIPLSEKLPSSQLRETILENDNDDEEAPVAKEA